MTRVYLLVPPSGRYRRDDRCQSRVEDQTIRVVLPPLDLATMAASLRNAGHEVRLADHPASGTDEKKIEEDVLSFAPDMLIYTCTAPTLDSDLRLADLIKLWRPDSRICIKGEPVNFLDESILTEHSSVDYVLRGEAEAIVKAHAEGRPLEEIPGVTWRENDSVERNPDPAAPLGLDELPYPARDLLDNSRYVWPETGDPMTTIRTSEGCPHECIFCPVVPLSGRKVRFRRVERIIDEIRECVDRLGIRHFLFHADTFTLKRTWVIDLCKAILDARLPIVWACNSRVDTIDEERLEWMKKAGCRIIGFGVESGSDEHLRQMKKGATTKDAKRAVELCRQYGVRSHAFFVFGFPWDTENSIRRTVDFARELDPDFFDFNLAYPIPGTELYRMVVDEGLCDVARLKQGGYSIAALRTRSVSAERLEALRRRALWRLYLRPRYVIRTLRNAGSPRVALRYCRAAATRVVNLLFGV